MKTNAAGEWWTVPFGQLTSGLPGESRTRQPPLRLREGAAGLPAPLKGAAISREVVYGGKGSFE